MVNMALRLYDAMLAEHLATHRQMAFVTGPRQVGKTTTCRQLATRVIYWDSSEGRDLVLASHEHFMERIGARRLAKTLPVMLFDELHKYARWKSFLKGCFDAHGDEVRVLVTGSSRMDVYRRGGDSLMGRYCLYRMHPFSVAEVVSPALPDPTRILRAPARIDPADFEALWRHGGYPEPFLKRDIRFSRRWQSLRETQLVREDIRDLSQVQQLDQLATLTALLATRSAHQLIYGNLAKEVRISIDTARRWVEILRDFHLGFLVRPWFRNVARALRKEPKWFLRDWARVEDAGDRAETFVACHLLKAVEGWTDLGLGAFELGYIRDKEKREVDFVVTRDGELWFLVEVKHRETSLGPALRHYQESLRVPFAFQVVIEADYVDADCFARPGPPLVVPARTFLSQLL